MSAQSKAALAAGGVLGSLVADEEVEASPWQSPVDALDRMLKIGMVKPQSAGNPAAVKSAYTKYQKAWKGSKAFREREQRAFEADQFIKFSETPLGGRIVADLEKMVGRPIMPIRGDRSNIGIIEQVGGIDVNTKVQGGNKFSQQHADTGRGWMSMFTVAKSVQNKINDIAEATGQSPIAIYNAMGENATDFSTPIAETMLKEVRELPLAKTDIKRFDDEMRRVKGYDGSQVVKKDKETGQLIPQFNKDGSPKLKPYWVGLESPNAMDQLMGTGEFPMEGAGKMRTAFATLMGKADYRDRGFPSYDKLIDATRDPDLLGAEVGESGLSMFEAAAQAPLRQKGVHKSYDTVIGGDYIGGLPDARGIPFEIMFPELYKYSRSLKNKKGNPLTHDQAIVASNIRKDGYQIADQQWLDGVMEYLQKYGKRDALAGTSVVGAGMANASEQPQGTNFRGIVDMIRDASNEADYQSFIDPIRYQDGYAQARQNPMPDVGSIEAPNSRYRELLAQTGDAMQNFEFPIVGAPAGATGNIFHDMAYGDTPEWTDAVAAPLEMFGFASAPMKYGLLNAYGADETAKNAILEMLLKQGGKF